MQTFIKLLADGLMIPLVLLAGYMLIIKVPRGERYDRYARIIMAGLTSYLAAKFIALLWQPEQLRPFQKMGVDAGAAYLNNPGFPSDHLLFATFLTLAVWYATRSKWAVGIMAGLTLAIGIGRVLALVHTPLDVAGGIVIGLIGGVWYISRCKKYTIKGIARKSKK